MDLLKYYRPGLFRDRMVLVTGGGSGIGLVAARGFAQLGAHVVLASRNAERLSSACEELKREGLSASWVQVNIRDSDDVHDVVSALVAQRGPIHVLFNNAGGQFPVREEELTANGWRSVIDLNLNGTFHCCSAVGKQMIAAGGGKIINMAISLVGRGSPGIAHRGAAAAGVVNLTQSLAIAWSEFNIQVNAVGPQYLSPGAQENYGPALNEYIAKVTPMGRWGREDEIAGAVVFLATPMADYTTGMLMQVDGGTWLGPGVNYRESDVLPT